LFLHDALSILLNHVVDGFILYHVRLNTYTLEEGRHKAEGRRQKAEGRRQKAEGRRQKGRKD
ncbi:MAG: hypothetical protein F6K13_32435, partial [Okeania sp. SIO2B9]|nr:hypothetical protein [Okeania sp. SIO2B9]